MSYLSGIRPSACHAAILGGMGFSPQTAETQAGSEAAGVSPES